MIKRKLKDRLCIRIMKHKNIWKSSCLCMFIAKSNSKPCKEMVLEAGERCAVQEGSAGTAGAGAPCSEG